MTVTSALSACTWVAMAVTACAGGESRGGVDEADELLGRRLGGVLLRDGIGLHMREASDARDVLTASTARVARQITAMRANSEMGPMQHGWRGIVHRLTPLTYRAVSSA